MSMRCSIADGESWHLYLYTYDDWVYIDRGFDISDEPERIFTSDEWKEIEKEILSSSVKQTQKLRAQLAYAKNALEYECAGKCHPEHNPCSARQVLNQLEIEPVVVVEVEAYQPYKGWVCEEDAYPTNATMVLFLKDSNEKT